MENLHASAELAHALKIRFGTAPHEPTDQQLQRIVAELQTLARNRQQGTGKAWLAENDWHDAVLRYCPTAGHYKYGAIDNSDLNALLAQAAQGPKQSPPIRR